MKLRWIEANLSVGHWEVPYAKIRITQRRGEMLTTERAYEQGAVARDGPCPYVDGELAKAWRLGRDEQAEVKLIDRYWTWRPIVWALHRREV